VMHLGSTESIKSFLEHSQAMSFMSVRAIQKELKREEFRIISIKDFEILRTFSFVNLHGQQDNLSSIFMQFANRHYNQK